MARRRVKKKPRRGGFPVENAPVTEPLDDIHPNAAGIDIGSQQHYVAVPEGRDTVSVRCFGTFTSDLGSLADWLRQCGITTVAMESTGIFWIPVYEVLLARGFDVRLVPPYATKSLPGRKTDVLDCQWIQQLHSYGLLPASFLPDDRIGVLRSFLRQRDRLVRSCSEHILHMQKALMEMNVQLHHVVDDITGVTGLRIIDAILNGERDPEELAKLRHPGCKNDEATIALGLQGNWRDDHLFALKQALDLYRYYHQKMAELDQHIESYLRKFDDRTQGRELPPPRVAKRKKKNNDPAFDSRALLFRMAGHDLTSINGIGPYLALQLVSEIGLDMSKWPTEKHFASWLTLCPGNHQTGGKQHRSKTHTRPSANRAAHLFRLAAFSLGRADCALGAYFRRMKARLGPPKATVATAHKLAKLVYRMLKDGKTYEDRGAAWYDDQFRDQQLKSLQRQAAKLGYTVAPTAP